MKRPMLSLIVLALCAGSITLSAAPAFAQRGEERRIERQERRFERRIERQERRYERRDERFERRSLPPRVVAPPRRFEDRRRAAPPSIARWRRGSVLPPHYRGVRIYAYERHRLRPPPPGYAWYRVGDDLLLTDVVTGLILEVAPAY